MNIKACRPDSAGFFYTSKLDHISSTVHNVLLARLCCALYCPSLFSYRQVSFQ